jgi:hypothetical protein
LVKHWFAELARGTHLRVALKHEHPVQTLGVKTAGALVCGLAVALWDLRNISGIDLDLPIRLIYLHGRSKLFWYQVYRELLGLPAPHTPHTCLPIHLLVNLQGSLGNTLPTAPTGPHRDP